MPLLRVQLVGSGEPDDYYTVPLPEFRMLEVDYKAGDALVWVPGGSVVSPALLASATTRDQGGVPVVVEVDPVTLTKLYDTLDARYAERAGEYRPTLAGA